MNIFISRIHYPIKSLGPGTRLGIWFQGCTIRCPGCISSDTWDTDRGCTTIEELMLLLVPYLDSADGITITGGEPFEQFGALKQLLIELRKRFSGDILVYSGFERAKLTGMLTDLFPLIDVLISEPFQEATLQTLPWRGSDNQIIECFTSLGKLRFASANDPSTANFKSLDIVFDEDSTLWMAGIPSRGDLDKLIDLLAEDGFRAASTSDRRK